MFLYDLYNHLIKKQMIGNGDKIVVGVSGGPDSMLLLHFLSFYRLKLNMLVYAVHINHHTRNDENTYEQNLISAFCSQNEIPFYVFDFHKSSKANFHEEARNFRFQCFKEIAEKVGGNKIAIAHHKNDQVETILFKLIRGNNLLGYSGIKDSYSLDNGLMLIRPFLSLTKKNIVSFCNETHIPYAIDSSNLKNEYTRNYLRNEVIPMLTSLQCDFDDKIIQFHEQLLEANEFLLENAKIILKQMIILNEKEKIILDNDQLKSIHVSVIRFILLEVITTLNKEIELTYEKVKNLLSIIFNEKPNISFNLGKGYLCIREYDKLIFKKDEYSIDEYNFVVDTEGEFELPNGMKISVKKVEEKAKINNKCLILCYNSTIWPLVIRNRNNGDYLATKIGKKKINRIFIDAKVPVSLRKTWPLLVDRNGVILWVIGIQKAYIEQPNCDRFLLIEVM